MDNCIFCKIGKGEIPTNVVYEDEHSIAFVDLYPAAPGHTLVIPKAHIETVVDMSAEEHERFMKAVYVVAGKVNRAFPSKRLGYLVKGFDVPHAHLHLIPMNSNDDIVSGKYGSGLPPQASPTEREETAAKIKST